MIPPTSPLAPNDAVQPAQWQSIAATPPAKDGPDFEKVFTQLIQDVDQAQKTADGSIKALATGNGQEQLQDVVLKLEEAELTFRLMKEIRDKLIQAYKEIISIQS